MIESRFAFLGAGNMAEALINGLIRAGAPANHITATALRTERLVELERRLNVKALADNVAAAKDAEVVVLCVKPQAMRKLLAQVAPVIDTKKLVISIAAGVPIAAIERKLGTGSRVVRAMPNTPALVGLGATAISGGEHATDKDLAFAQKLFDAVGITTVLDDEHLLDAVTGLSGSGPAYVFLMIEALSDAGVKVGLSRRVSLELAAQTVLGSAKLLIETKEHPGALKDQVTSPGGTAIAGLHTLEAGGLRTTLIDAVEAATKRAKELGQSFLEDGGSTP